MAREKVVEGWLRERPDWKIPKPYQSVQDLDASAQLQRLVRAKKWAPENVAQALAHLDRVQTRIRR